MSYVSKNPRFTTTSVTDSTTGTISSPPSGVDKIINRNGVLYLKNSAGGETPIGSSSGGKNYLAKQSDASAAVGTVSVVAAGADISVSGTFPNVSSAWYADAGAAAIAISSDNTLRGTSNYLTALTSFSAAGAVYVQTPVFNIDGEDLGKALAVQFDVAGNTTADDWDVVAVRYTSAGVFGALIPIAGIASTTTGTASAQVPTGTTTFRGFFITGSTASDVYSIRWRRRAGAVAIRFDNLIVGPNSVMLGTAITDWQSYTPTGSWTANTTYTGKYARVGQNLLLDILVSTSGAPTAASLTVNIPSGLVIDTSALTSFVNGLSTLGGVGVVNDSTTTAYNIQVVYSSTTAVRVLFQNNASGAQTAVNATAPITFGAGDSVNFQCSVPIVGYSSNVTMADRAVEEYAWNSATADSSDTTSFAYGPSGVNIGSYSTAERTKRIRFQTAVQSTDSIFLEIYDGTNWVQGSGIFPFSAQSTRRYGILLEPVTGTADYQVVFPVDGARITGATYASAGAAWSGFTAYKWRVRKVSGGAAVGFPIAPANITLIDSTDNYSGNTKLGFMQYVHGTTYNGGVAPTISVTNLSSVSFSAFIPYQMSDGTWRLRFNFGCVVSVAASVFTVTINGVTFKSGAEQAIVATSSTAAAYILETHTNSNAATMYISFSTTVTSPKISGDVILNSKPTWAY